MHEVIYQTYFNHLDRFYYNPDKTYRFYRAQLKNQAMLYAITQGWTADAQGNVYETDGSPTRIDFMGDDRYMQFRIRVPYFSTNKNMTMKVHRFVYLYFNGDKIWNHESICHLDDDANNNALANLKPDTQRNNQKAISKESRQRSSQAGAAQRIAGARLTDEQVRAIRLWNAEEGIGATRIKRRLSDKFGITFGETTIRDLLNGKYYKQVI